MHDYSILALFFLQNPKWTKKATKFHLWRIEEDGIEMNMFIKEKLGAPKFMFGNVFYEFKGDQPEDLQYYREVLHIPVDKVIFLD